MFPIPQSLIRGRENPALKPREALSQIQDNKVPNDKFSFSDNKQEKEKNAIVRHSIYRRNTAAILALFFHLVELDIAHVKLLILFYAEDTF